MFLICHFASTLLLTPAYCPVLILNLTPGVAISRDGISWSRSGEAVAGARGEDAAADVGEVLTPNGDWWTFDTCHLHASDVQVCTGHEHMSGLSRDGLLRMPYLALILI